MRVRNIRLALFAFPVVVVFLLVFALVVQQVFQEKALPESERPLPRVSPPDIYVPKILNASSSQAKLAVEETGRLIDFLNKSGIPIGGFEIDFGEMNSFYEGENVTALLRRADLLNQTPEQKEIADQIYALVYAAVRTGQKLGTNYTFVVEKSYELNARAKTAASARDALRLLDITMREQDSGLNISETVQFNEQALIFYDEGRFSDVFAKVNDAFSSLEKARVDLSRSKALLKASRRTLWYFFVDNWLWVLFACGLFGVVGFIANNEIQLYIWRSRLSAAQKDSLAVKQMMKSCQEEYYNQSLGQTRYKNRMAALTDRFSKLRVEIPSLRKKIKRRSVWSVSFLFKKF